MPASIDTHLLTVVLVVALVAWRFYARLGIALSLLLVLRIGYRFVMLPVGGGGTSSLAMQPGGSPPRWRSWACWSATT